MLQWGYSACAWCRSCTANGKRRLVVPGLSGQCQQFVPLLGSDLNHTLWLKLPGCESLPPLRGEDPDSKRNSVSEEQHLRAEAAGVWLLITATNMSV